MGGPGESQVKRGKKVASNSGKTTAEPRGNVNGANAGRGLMANGVLSSNLTQVGNFVGAAGNNYLEGTYTDMGTRAKSGAKKVTSKMVSTNGAQKAAQHQ